MPTIENLVAGLRKKYGEENYYEPTGVELQWVFDAHGEPVVGRPGREIATHCKGMFLNPEVPDLRGGRELLNRTGGSFVLPGGDPKKLHTCSEWVLVNVKILRAPRVNAADGETLSPPTWTPTWRTSRCFLAVCMSPMTGSTKFGKGSHRRS